MAIKAKVYIARVLNQSKDSDLLKGFYINNTFFSLFALPKDHRTLIINCSSRFLIVINKEKIIDVLLKSSGKAICDTEEFERKLKSYKSSKILPEGTVFIGIAEPNELPEGDQILAIKNAILELMQTNLSVEIVTPLI